MRLTAGNRIAGLAAAALLSAAPIASAETVMTVGDIEIDSVLFDLYLESRTQTPADQATPEQRAAIEDELTDIYLLSQQPRTEELAADPQVEAQIELQRRGLLAQITATDFLSRNRATEEEIQAEYAEQLELAPDTQQIKARHILVETQAAAVDLIAELDDGADFAQLAISNSTGPSGPSGGDLGWFSPNSMVPEFRDAVSAMENGTYSSEPVQTQFGWHVILREDSRAEDPPPLEGVRDMISQRIEQRKLQEYLQQLRELEAN